jgi:hypothetical protein
LFNIPSVYKWHLFSKMPMRIINIDFKTGAIIRIFLKCILSCNYLLGQVNLISRLSSRVTKKYRARGRILFYNFYFPKEKLLMTILCLSTKGVSFNAPYVCSWHF